MVAERATTVVGVPVRKPAFASVEELVAAAPATPLPLYTVTLTSPGFTLLGAAADDDSVF
ncbi:hypothetical protein GCM10025867_22840 [Frondihabitans sucicola]|uniref:Uncharacterized protein n=1 Tax=Frondihabitans sucicola TaxID=1268041 RepID=A0ABM8GNQ2_9MICO|nr:hypothetical protein GCM10025867_22840 [Frondihabitans sucicola]